MVLKKKKYLTFFILTFIMLVDKNVSAAPLCLEEENNIQNKEIVSNEKLSKENIDTIENKNNNLENTNWLIILNNRIKLHKNMINFVKRNSNKNIDDKFKNNK